MNNPKSVVALGAAIAVLVATSWSQYAHAENDEVGNPATEQRCYNVSQESANTGCSNTACGWEQFLRPKQGVKKVAVWACCYDVQTGMLSGAENYDCWEAIIVEGCCTIAPEPSGSCPTLSCPTTEPGEPEKPSTS